MEPQEFFRQPTDTEKKDFTPIIGTRVETKWEKYRKELIVKDQEYTEKKKPFCFRCARSDFKKKYDDKARDLIEKKGYVDYSKLDKTVETPELEDYGKPERFEVVKESKAMEDVPTFVSGRSVHHKVQTGIHRDYKCKVCEGLRSIMITFEELEKEAKKK